MEPMSRVRRSNSFELGKETKFSFGMDRNRNDSGCFEDFDPTGSPNSEDPVVTYWEEAIAQWSDRAKSVIAQEVIRMKELTKKRKRDLLKQEDRDKVHQAWKHNMRETMDLALDLMKCVSYDIIEEFGFEPTPVENYQKPKVGLDKIAEEEIDECLEKRKPVFIIRVDHRIRRIKPLKRRHLSKSPFAKNITTRGNRTKVPKNTLTFLLDELKELRKLCGPKKESWSCRNCLTSSTWNDNDPGPKESVEDIFSDWIRLQKKSDIGWASSDINAVFWNLSLDKGQVRTRRLSEVLDEMHFGDRPDIFHDRCEILESDLRIQKKKPSVKSYWNIFHDWKQNLNEVSPSMSPWKILEKKKNAQNASLKIKSEQVSQEDIFKDFLPMFEQVIRGVRRRSLDEDDEDDIIILSSPNKKIKRDFMQIKRRRSSQMAYRFGKAYKSMAINLLVAMGSVKKAEVFEFWSSNSIIENLVQSRNDFCTLRLEMRKQRQQNREMNQIVAPETWMQEWNWNLEEKEDQQCQQQNDFDNELLIKTHKEFCRLRSKVKQYRQWNRQSNESSCPEFFMAEWKWNMEDPKEDQDCHTTRRPSDPARAAPEDIFVDWRRLSQGSENSDDAFTLWIKNTRKRTTNKNRRLSTPSDHQVWKPPASSNKIAAKASQIPDYHPKDFCAKLPQAGKPKSAKLSHRLMAKCYAKQPHNRGLY